MTKTLSLSTLHVQKPLRKDYLKYIVISMLEDGKDTISLSSKQTCISKNMKGMLNGLYRAFSNRSNENNI